MIEKEFIIFEIICLASDKVTCFKCYENLPWFWHNLAFPGSFHRLSTEPPSSNSPQIHRPVA